MNLLMITALDAAGAALADKLSDTTHVKVLHPKTWGLESRFEEKQTEPEALSCIDLSGYGAVVYLASPELKTSYLESILEHLTSWEGIPFLCVCPRSATEREGTPARAEEALCTLYRERRQVCATHVSVPALYGEDFLPEEIMRTLLKRPSRNRIELRGAAEEPCDMLHTADLAALLDAILENREDKGRAITIGSGHAAELGEVAGVIRTRFRLTELRFTPAERPAVPVRTGDHPGWMPRHSFMQELPEVLARVEERGLSGLFSRRSARGRMLGKVFLFLLLFACTCLYTGFIKVSSELQFVDVRLLFVVGVSLYMGRGFGLAAGICASLAGITEAIAAGTRWYTLFFHIDNWIPMAVYLAAAVLLGMYSENHRLKEDEENE